MLIQKYNLCNYSLQHYTNTIDCYETVKYYSEKYWNNRDKNESYENYRFDSLAPNHALGPMLLNGQFHGGYTILLQDNEPISFGGIRKYTENIALICARNFCFYTFKPVTHGIMVPFHLDYCKELGFTKAWTTVNDYNLHRYDVWYNKKFNKNHNKTTTNKNDKIYLESDRVVRNSINIGKKVINNVEQTVIEWPLEIELL